MEEKMIEVIKRAQNGDEDAFNELYQHYYRRAFLYAMKLCKNEADAHDAVQDSFISIHKALPNLKEPEFFGGWLSKIVFSKCTHIFRSNKDVFLSDEKLLALDQSEKRKEFLPDFKIREQSDHEILESMIEKLSPKFRDIIKAVYLEQKSLKETSQLYNIPVGTVKSRTAQGKAELKTMIKAFELREGRPLDFKLHTPIGFGIVGMISSKFKYGAQFATGEVFKVVVIIAITTVTVGASTEMYKHWKYEKQIQNELVNSLIPSSQSTEEYKDAYFSLMYWASTKEEMEKKTVEEIESIRPLYEKLKATNNSYHAKLESINWFTNYESL